MLIVGLWGVLELVMLLNSVFILLSKQEAFGFAQVLVFLLNCISKNIHNVYFPLIQGTGRVSDIWGFPEAAAQKYLPGALRSGFKNTNTHKSLPTWAEPALSWMFVCGLSIHNLWLNPQSSLQTRGFVEQRSLDSRESNSRSTEDNFSSNHANIL